MAAAAGNAEALCDLVAWGSSLCDGSVCVPTGLGPPAPLLLLPGAPHSLTLPPWGHPCYPP